MGNTLRCRSIDSFSRDDTVHAATPIKGFARYASGDVVTLLVKNGEIYVRLSECPQAYFLSVLSDPDIKNLGFETRRGLLAALQKQEIDPQSFMLIHGAIEEVLRS